MQLLEEDFEYEPLPGLDYIRVLNIAPSTTFYDPIVCVVEAVPHSRSASYVALSYSWGMNADGDATPNRLISIGGRVKRITQNLYECLLRLRAADFFQQEANSDNDEPAPLRMWIDAICINQEDNVERAQQVSNMRFVYANAQRTVVWLGEDDCPDEGSLLHTTLECFNSSHPASNYNFPHTWQRATGQKHYTCFLYQRDYETQDLLQHNDNDPVSHLPINDIGSVSADRERLEMDVAREILRFAKRRYFSRRWVVQELFYSNKDNTQVRWGHCQWSLHQILQTFSKADTYALPRLIDNRMESSLHHLKQLGSFLSTPRSDTGHEDLTHALSSCWRMECSDPRDLLYSLVGLAPSVRLFPDYSISVAKSYTSFARLLIEAGQVETLLLAKKQDKQSEDLPLPTWVPDLRLPFYRYYSPRTPAETSHQDNTSQDASVRLATVDEHDVLAFPAYICGRVNYVTTEKNGSQSVSIETARASSTVQVPEADAITKLHLPTYAADTADCGDLCCSTRTNMTASGNILFFLRGDAPSKLVVSFENHDYEVKVSDELSPPRQEVVRIV